MYTHITDKLAIGQVIKVPHDGCSESNALRIERLPKGVTFYCYKCGEYWFNSEINSLAETQRRQKIYDATKKKQAERNISLPVDFSQNIRASGLVWLGKAGITNKIIQLYNIGWSDSLNRVIIPIYRDKKYIGYVARSVEKFQQPKYLECLLYKYPFYINKGGGTLCIVEDILSAIRISRYTSSLALLGTKLNQYSSKIINRYEMLIVWLDPDKAGIKGSILIRKKYNGFKIVIIIKSLKDPKLLNDVQMDLELTKAILLPNK